MCFCSFISKIIYCFLFDIVLQRALHFHLHQLIEFSLQRCYKKELDMAGAGYYSLITMMGSIPDIVKIERPVNNGDWLLIPAVEG